MTTSALAVTEMPTPMKRPRRAGEKRFRSVGSAVGAGVVVILAMLVAAFPLVVILVTAFTPESQVVSWPPKLVPSEWVTSNFVGVFDRIPVWTQLRNTVVMAVCVTGLSLFLDSLMAYALACIPFRGRGVLLGVLIATMMVPFQSLLVPLYRMLSDFGWIGTMVGLVVPRAADVAGIFLLRQFFVSVPRDLDSAARIDGASEFRIYWNIILPNATGGLLVLGMFNFIGNWNDMLWPMVMTSTADQRTLTAGLAILNGTSMGVVPYGVTMAGSLISVVPLIIVFALVQKRFIENLATSGLKG